MNVYLMRHAEPVRPTEWEGPDSSRPLSKKGMDDVSASFEGMKKKEFHVTRIFSSPLERAKQTAELMKIYAASSLELKDQLRSGVRPSDIREFVLSLENVDNILLVGHMPDMALFAASVVPDPQLLNSGLRPGEIWAIETGALEDGWGTGTFLWKRTIDEWKNS